MRNILNTFYKDKVFLIAFVIAIVSMFFVLPSMAYVSYINYKVLVVMFTLMIAVSGIYETHFFDYVATKLVIKFRSIQSIGLVIVLVTFFLAMLLTNDAVLLTLIPFTIFVTKHTKMDKYALYIIILQTVAANLGSALTPMGDPQNIYLYAYFDIPFKTFLSYTFPISLIGLILIVATTFMLVPKKHAKLNLAAPKVEWIKLFLYALLLVNALLLVLRVYDVLIALSITLLCIACFGNHLVRKVDYPLLLTFVSFFIITGNLSHIDFVQAPLQAILSSEVHVYYAGLLVSQVISNVPAAVLLSTFTDPLFAKSLLQGVNVGAMGSLIGSLASLITFKYVVKSYPKDIKKYILQYTFICVIFILIMTIVLRLFF